MISGGLYSFFLLFTFRVVWNDEAMLMGRSIGDAISMPSLAFNKILSKHQIM